MVFNLDFAKNTIVSCFFFLFLIIDLYFLILAVIIKIFYLIVEVIIPIGISTPEAKSEMEGHPLTVEIKISRCST